LKNQGFMCNLARAIQSRRTPTKHEVSYTNDQKYKNLNG
jgi:hypothetical protein